MEPTKYQPPTDRPLAPDYGPPPGWPYAYPPTTPVRPIRKNRLKTAVAGLALAGLLVAGGVATVFAADPSPSPTTPAAVTSPDASPGTIDGTGHTRGDCPDKTTTTTDDTTSTDSSS